MRKGAVVGAVLSFGLFIVLAFWGDGDNACLFGGMMLATALICASIIEK